MSRSSLKLRLDLGRSYLPKLIPRLRGYRLSSRFRPSSVRRLPGLGPLLLPGGRGGQPERRQRQRREIRHRARPGVGMSVPGSRIGATALGQQGPGAGLLAQRVGGRSRAMSLN
jgi:hypothetical protein